MTRLFPSRPSTRRMLAATLVTGAAMTGAALAGAPSAQATPTNPPSSLIAFSTHSSGSNTLGISTLDTSGVQTDLAANQMSGVGIAYDAAGNLFWNTDTTVYEVMAGTTTSTPVVTGLSGASFLSLDPSGNIYVSSFNAMGIVKIEAGSHALATLDPGRQYSGLAGVKNGDLYAVSYDAGTSTSTLLDFADGTGAPTIVASAAAQWFAVGGAPDGSVWVSDSTNQQLIQFSPAGTSLSSIPASSFVLGLAVDAAGNVYDGEQLTIREYPAGSSTGTTIAVEPVYPGSLTTVPTWWIVPTAPAPAPTAAVPTAAPAKPVLTKARARVVTQRLVVTAANFQPGEAYKIRLHGHILKRGTASATGSIVTRVRLPHRLRGVHRVKVIGTTSGKVGKRFRIARHA